MFENILDLASTSTALNIDGNTVTGLKYEVAGSLEIPEGITVIADGAFEDNTAITDVKLPSSLRVIEKHAFRGCTNLTAVTFAEDSHLTVIGDGCFTRCSLSKIEIPNTVEELGSEAFSCQSFDLQVSKDTCNLSRYNDLLLKKLSTEALLQKQIATVTIPEGAIVKGRCFAGTLIDTVVVNSFFVKRNAFANACIRKIIWNSESRAIPEDAFADNCHLQEFVISERAEQHLHTIGAFAFQNCVNLKHFRFTDELEIICDFAFINSGLLEFAANKNLQIIGQQAFNFTHLLSVDLSSSKNLQKVGAMAFAHTSISSLYVNPSQEILTDDIVQDCRNLKTLIIGENVKLFNCQRSVIYGIDFADAAIYVHGAETKLDGTLHTPYLFVDSKKQISDLHIMPFTTEEAKSDITESYNRCLPRLPRIILKEILC